MTHVKPLLLALTLTAAVGQAEDPPQVHGDAGILFWSAPQQVLGYRSIDRLFPTREIAAGPLPYPLLPGERDFSGFRYVFGGERHRIDDYMQGQRIAGLIAIKDDKVMLERYGLGNSSASRWISFSVAKSVVSLLYGAALRDGYIRSPDERVVDYLPRLKGGAYDSVSIRQILQMASGVAWNEDYTDAESDTALAPGGGMGLIDYMRELPRAAAPGSRFNYNTGETSIAGAVLRAAIGNNLSTYLSHRIWRPFGMEANASWLLHEAGGVEYGGCCINATLRDYARIGLFLLRDGVTPSGRRILPQGYVAQSLAASPADEGYGYYWWRLGEGRVAALGIFGQMIWVDPTRNIVIAQHGAWRQATGEDLSAHRRALVHALADAL